MAGNLSPTFLIFRESHHAVAKMFAAGMTISMVSHKTGYTRRRLHILLNSPSFQELIMEYAKTADEKFDEASDTYAELAVSNMIRAEAQIQEKLDAAEEADEPLPMRELLAIAKDRADRFGYGPKSTRINVDVTFAAQLDRAIERSAKIIEARPLGAPHPPSKPQPEGEPRPIEQHAISSPASGDVRVAPVRSKTPASSRTGPSFVKVLRRELRA